MSLSVETLNLLAVILSQQTVSLADPNFDDVSAALGKARKELLAALDAASGPASAPNRATRRHPPKAKP